MRSHLLLCLFVASTLRSFGQSATPPSPPLPKDPRALLAVAAPNYDFNDPTLKPWHLKATYQLYDDYGKPTEKGTFEYWWASPKVHRSTWTRPSATHTDWYTADGKYFLAATGEPLKFFEYQVGEDLFSPLPESRDLDPANATLDMQMLQLKGIKVPCVMPTPLIAQAWKSQTPLGSFPTYCFDPNVPALRITYSFGSVVAAFNNIVKVQNRFLPRELLLLQSGHNILTATVDTIATLDPSDPALIPPPTSSSPQIGRVGLSAGVTVGMLVKKQQPVYPQDAKDLHISGRVVLQAVIGRDGGIHHLRVVSGPWWSLIDSALWCVSHWEYRPYTLNGEPVEVETTINVIYTLGGR